jgi:hypothetical protein
MKLIFLFIGILVFGEPAEAEGRTVRVNPSRAWFLARRIIECGWPGVKPWWASKTIWFNTSVATFLLAEQNIQSMSGLIPDWLYKPLVCGLPFINLWLRIGTTQGLSFKPQMPRGEKDAQ